ncbi:choline/ethanolaminephosphotransferase 1 isoform X2 [Rhipicephalus sanguineus]|uniref:choline/ethanolaminephosphotransferase 1 isoform X2 n=1 Tax=Rhipicephalus sanguineus TaxID=34632 RepID=UPI0020C35E3E|nr:choline/ethanolaminephosphotransferase 1 isoform X2 [Rhipicephalus sanguineus]
MIFSSADMLSQQQLKRLSEHKYSCSGSSFADPLMQPFWNWVTSKCPLWLAPNLMTLSGLFVNIATSLLLVWYSPTATQEVPRWAFLLCALGLFVYQTLDACDGKQARRTGTNTPLGELFDHGCDSISTVFVALAVCIAVKLGSYPGWMFFQCFVAITLFYCAHWQTYVSGTLRFGKFDVTEAQFSVMMIHIISAIFGSDIWATKVPFIELPLKFLPLCSGLTAGSIALFSYAGTIFTGGVGKNGSTVALPLVNVELRLLPVATALSVSIIMCYTDIAVILSGGVGKNGSTVAGTSVLSPSIPIALVVVPAFIIYQKSSTSIYENHPCLYIIAFGMVAAKVTNRLVVAHMCRSEMDYMDSALLGPGMLFLNQYFNTFINEYIILLVCLVYSVADLLHYSVIVCNQICAHLQIPLLRIVPKYAVDTASSSVSSDKHSATQSQAEEACALLTPEEPPPYHESLMELDCETVHA